MKDVEYYKDEFIKALEELAASHSKKIEGFKKSINESTVKALYAMDWTSDSIMASMQLVVLANERKDAFIRADGNIMDYEDLYNCLLQICEIMIGRSAFTFPKHSTSLQVRVMHEAEQLANKEIFNLASELGRELESIVGNKGISYLRGMVR